MNIDNQNFESDLNYSGFPSKKLKKKPVDPKRSPLYMKLEQIENKINSLQDTLNLVTKALKIEQVKNHLARKSNNGSNT